MNIWIKRAMVAAGVTTAMALPLSGVASDGTITFTGAVTASTCTVTVNGNAANATVALPTVSTAALDNTATKTTAAGTFFNMAVTACTAVADIGSGPAHAPTTVQIYYEAGPNVDEATGGLINTVAGSNVEVNLYNASGSTKVGTQIMPGTGTNQPTALSIAASTGVLTQTEWFYAGYSTAGAALAATAGAVSTSVTYSLIYQ
jgi:major type 1 subunit fimbrin (pilin)